MGMYTELYISFGIKKDTPNDVVEVLRALFDHKWQSNLPHLPNHEFFECPRWRMIGSCSSFYFVPFATSAMHVEYDGRVFITSRSDLKNYDNEIQKFINWVTPYIDAFIGEHIGHMRYEEDDEPTILKMGGEV